MLTAIAACHRTPTARERVLEKLPRGTSFIATADGPVLSDPTFRRVIDASRARVPASFGCVIDAALASDIVALSGDRTGVAVAILTRASVAKCPALSKVDTELWTATIGGGALATSASESAANDPRWSRARRYLVTSPLALAADLGTRHVIAAAQADPIVAWISIDADDAALAMTELTAITSRWRTLPVFGKLVTKRDGSQITVRADTITASDLGDVVADLWVVLDSVPPRAPAPPLSCPPPDDLVSSCTPGPHLKVTSLARALIDMTNAPADVVIENGDVVGMRLRADAQLVLRKGDVIVAINSRRAVSLRELASLVAQARGRATMTIDRNGAQSVIELLE